MEVVWVLLAMAALGALLLGANDALSAARNADPMNPPMVQVGHVSLASGSASESGKVFFNQVDMETSRFWNCRVCPKP
jgi:hypothetical protein